MMAASLLRKYGPCAKKDSSNSISTLFLYVEFNELRCASCKVAPLKGFDRCVQSCNPHPREVLSCPNAWKTPGNKYIRGIWGPLLWW